MNRDNVIEKLDELEEELIQCFYVAIRKYLADGDMFSACKFAYFIFKARFLKKL